MYTILGAGLSGISVADHLEKKGMACEVYESKNHGGGHIFSEIVDGFCWDEGPHVSFTSYDYVKKYFAENCGDHYLEFPTKPANYFHGNWIMHPAQSHMYAVPEPLRSECINDVKFTRERLPADFQPADYQEWIDFAFGKTFAKIFPAVYTKKYWTTEPKNLTTDWIGKRIYFPEIADMVNSANGPIEKQTHYISKVRYPINGGYYTYIKSVEDQLSINFNRTIEHISFGKKEVLLTDGKKLKYDKLVATLPLPKLISNSDAPRDVKNAAEKLKCSQVLIINVVANHPAQFDNHWIYVYDETFYSTRISFTELLSPGNGQPGKTGIQVEVYFSAYHTLNKSVTSIAKAVLQELIVMKIIQSEENIEKYHTKWLDWANVIFDNARMDAQDTVFSWLETQGLVREDDDLQPMTDWRTKKAKPLGDIILAGRFAQWKYFWTDDCVMRGLFIAACTDNANLNKPVC